MRTLTLSVLQLGQYVKRIVDAEELLAGIGLFGEVSNFKISAGNAYFDLKEDGASISCMMFGSDVVPLENGKQVMLFGRLSYYVKTGRLSFVARRVEEVGKGALYEKYLELKAKLEKEGLFDPKIKKPLPSFAKKIGLVTSETGAVLRDILKVARKKNNKTDFVLFPAKVQGVGAEETIARGIDYFSESDVDVVIVARGGGSFEDLAPFNTERVVRAIFACKKPVISAVGHETDISISDFAADLRCATPSVAGEVAVFDIGKTLDLIRLSYSRVNDAALDLIEKRKVALAEIARSNECTLKLAIEEKLNTMQKYAESTKRGIELLMQASQNAFEKLLIRIEKDSPMALLARGYLTAQKHGKRLNSIDEIEEGEQIELEFADGKAGAKILSKEKRNDI